MQEIPLQPIPSQFVKTVLDGQNFQIAVYQKDQGLFVDVNVNGDEVSSGTIARDTARLISREYLPVLGNLLFVDTQGNSDPHYLGLGGRYSFVYITEDENAQLLK